MDARGRHRSAVRRRAGRRRPGPARKKTPGGGSRRRLVQLLVSAALFFLVFAGRGVFPEQLAVWGRLLRADVDFQGVFRDFQSALAQGEGVQEALGALGAAVLGAQPEEQTPVPQGPEEPLLLSRTSRLGLDYAAQAGVRAPVARQNPTEEDTPQPEPAPEVVTAVAQAYTDDGVALPSNVSLAYYELGLEETAVPVQGSITSTFGYRDSPIDGDREFHLALDIGAAEGTPIGAFAAGTVEYIGQSDEFGQYLKLRHANNVASFYAHCSKLLVQKGDAVSCGQTVALVGSTGNATGPHLHLTIEKDNIRLDPAYYVELS